MSTTPVNQMSTIMLCDQDSASIEPTTAPIDWWDLELHVLYIAPRPLHGLERVWFINVIVQEFEFYRPIEEGLGISLPLTPTFANICMCHNKNKLLKICPSSYPPLLYKLFVDCTFLLFRSESHVELFLNYLHTKHSSKNFTMENKIWSTRLFLDYLVTMWCWEVLFLDYRITLWCWEVLFLDYLITMWCWEVFTFWLSK